MINLKKALNKVHREFSKAKVDIDPLLTESYKICVDQADSSRVNCIKNCESSECKCNCSCKHCDDMMSCQDKEGWPASVIAVIYNACRHENNCDNGCKKKAVNPIGVPG